MKKIIFVGVMALYVSFACNRVPQNNGEPHVHTTSCDHDAEGHSHEEHDHEGHDHEASDHEGHDHEASEHEGHDHDAAFGVVEMDLSAMNAVVKASGEVISSQGDEVVISAYHSGIVMINQSLLLSGKEVDKGEHLLTISGSKMIDNSLKVAYLKARSDYESSDVNYKRVKQLYENKLVSEAEYVASRNTFMQAEAAYDALKSNYVQGGQKVLASQPGYIKNILVKEGEFVEAGAPLVSITLNKKMLLKAEVSQQYFGQMNKVTGATFKLPYREAPYTTEALNGRLISYGKTISDDSFFIPLYFEIESRPDILSGSFVTIFLRTAEQKQVMALPREALLEEQGSYFVYVEEGEAFKKRYVTLGDTDGERVVITSGLMKGDHVATSNVYRIKLLSMTSALPAHNHNH